jgi:hypothetical protein
MLHGKWVPGLTGTRVQSGSIVENLRRKDRHLALVALATNEPFVLKLMMERIVQAVNEVAPGS